MSIENEAQKIREKLKEERQTKVSVALFGQPGAGKSTLINKIVGKKVAGVGPKTDHTKQANSYEANGLRFVDLPGYGTKNFPSNDYFEKFDIDQFDLFLCVTSGKLHKADTEFFRKLIDIGKVCIYVVNKSDNLWEPGKTIEELEIEKRVDISEHVGQSVEVIFTSCKNEAGLDKLISEIHNNLDEAKQERWLRSAKAYSDDFLEIKKESSKRYVAIASGVAAVNGTNPVPGADIAVDVSIIRKLFKEIRQAYGLDEDALSNLKKSAIPAVSQMANRVIKYATKEGILLLLKRYAGQMAVENAGKYIPIVGQAIAAVAGFGITYSAGKSYLNDCHELSKVILDKELEY